MASIGSLTVDMIHGRPAPLKTVVETWRVPGLDGYGAQTQGFGDAEFDLTSIAYVADSSTADALLAAAAALQGTVVAIMDNWGKLFGHCVVTGVETSGPGAKKACRRNNAAAVRVEIKWKMVTASL